MSNNYKVFCDVVKFGSWHKKVGTIVVNRGQLSGGRLLAQASVN